MSEEVKKMFAEISGRYDFMNTFLSFGMHKLWRKRAVKYAGTKPGDSVLDCASGTGDLAIEFKKKTGITGRVVAQDFCREMLEYIKPKITKEKIDIEIETGDVQNLNHQDNTFDISSISFGLRNLDDPIKGLKEMARVVKPDGKVIIVETGQPKKLFYMFYKIYSKYFMPIAGRLLAKNKSAYEYLPETASKFPYGDKLVEMMISTEMFSDIKMYPQTLGVAYIYIGTVRK
ncbi:MAG TPA: bifunctional demethylmenaquinone methyltransferase/2-methoxy-6-polyprenyl-1,4-benzoquinol methylase UbiE [Ignavibacteria bacterium]